MSSCLSSAPRTPLPPRFWARYRSVRVRLAYPVSVIVTTTSSRAMRSSSVTSPSAGMMRVRRSSPYFSTISASSALTLRLGQDVLVVGDLELDRGELIDDLLALQCRQAAQLHVEDRLRLVVVDLEEVLEALSGDLDRLRPTDQGDDLVERIECLDQTTKNVGALLGLVEQVLGAPDDDLDLVRDVQTHEMVQRQRPRDAVHDGQHVGAERRLQLRVLVEVVQHHLGHGVTLERDDDAQTDAV